MAEPTTPAATAPAAQPKVKTEIEKRYDEAGYARNRAELAYNNAVKEHGKDSAEAKAAKTVLEEKQAAVEAIQKEITGASKPQKVAKAASKKEAPPQAKIEKIVVELPKLKEHFRAMEYMHVIQPKAAYLYEVRSEVVFRRDFSKFIDKKMIQEMSKCIEQAKKEKKDAKTCVEKLLDKPPALPKPLQQAVLSKTN